MAYRFEQGDIIKVENHRNPLLVVSKDTFNQSGQALCCPLARDVFPEPLHIRVQGSEISGTVLCEQIRFFDLRSGKYSKLDSLDLRTVMDITDAIQGIFDYY